MPTDRLFRNSMCGVMLLLFLSFFYFLFGGKISDLLVWGPLIGLFISTPVIGLIISTFSFWRLYKKDRRNIHYYVPDDKVILDYIFRTFKDDKEISAFKGDKESSENWRLDEIDKFYPYYQTQVRAFITGEKMQYLERKWSVFWIHTNGIFSIWFAFWAVVIYHVLFIISQLILDGFLCINFTNFCDRFISDGGFVFRLIGLVIVGFYCRIAKKTKEEAKEHGKAFEHAALKEAILNKLKGEEKAKPTLSNFINTLFESFRK